MNNIRYWCFAIIVAFVAFTISCVRLNIKADKPAAVFKNVPIHQVETPHEMEKSPVVIPPQVEPKKKPEVDPMEAIYEADRLLQEKFAPFTKDEEEQIEH